MRNFISVFLAFVFSFTFVTSCLASQAIHKNIESCTNYKQYFKFYSTYKEGEYPLYMNSENFHVQSTLPVIAALPTGYTDTFLNEFLSDEENIMTGEVHLVKGEKKIKALCGLTFACECTGNFCHYHVITNGSRCNIKGDGTQAEPYVFELT